MRDTQEGDPAWKERLALYRELRAMFGPFYPRYMTVSEFYRLKVRWSGGKWSYKSWPWFFSTHVSMSHVALTKTTAWDEWAVYDMMRKHVRTYGMVYGLGRGTGYVTSHGDPYDELIRRFVLLGLYKKGKNKRQPFRVWLFHVDGMREISKYTPYRRSQVLYSSIVKQKPLVFHSYESMLKNVGAWAVLRRMIR